MNPENIVKLLLEYAATFVVADLNDPDEVQGAEELLGYYLVEKFTAEEKEVIHWRPVKGLLKFSNIATFNE